ncbi:amidase, Asp-tRNAAsn/Glu-tRNAGln amidotransferase A subunit [Thermus oshimai JL-2]|uniref:Amidase, Asp-tRNAAsn/Glu-tRNAGln amidotransferase A subunit n=1 Tax=Thermus oshimai JL-2 TaxID=751945 RepID=K7QW79_THEOS|nr:amidase [Thermus oshimai]AFV76881.1 amidase, Asp-tRNAAsn/Glu-tRNAGln amidotransferase A subunit [Thermus oshimai JL-2]
MDLLSAKALLEAGKTTPLDLLEEALERARAFQDRNALAYLDEEAARQEALALTEELRQGRLRGPLHGLPLTVKDLFPVRGMPTRAGTRAPLPPLPEEARAVERLREAGALLFAKTNMHEIALGITGENPWTGPVRNALDPTRQAGGSSGGSAVAVALGIGLASLGSDTGGSIRIPAAFNGVVGFKPSYGRVSLEGALPLSRSTDHAGPIAKTVRDAHFLTEILAGEAIPLEGPQNPTFGVPLDFLEGRLGVGVRKAFQRLLEDLPGLRAEVREVSLPLRSAYEVYTRLTRYEAARIHEKALKEHPEGFSPQVRLALEEGLKLTEKDYRDAVAEREALRLELAKALRGVDALLLPTQPLPAPPLGTEVVELESGPKSHREAFITLTLPFSLLGVPTLTLTFARVEGMPVGVQVVGPYGEDGRVLAIGGWLEARLR